MFGGIIDLIEELVPRALVLDIKTTFGYLVPKFKTEPYTSPEITVLSPDL